MKTSRIKIGVVLLISITMLLFYSNICYGKSKTTSKNTPKLASVKKGESKLKNRLVGRKLRVKISHYQDFGCKTSTGRKPCVGRTLAVSRSLKHLMGKKIYIPKYGIGIVEDLMSKKVKGNHIDIYVKSYRKAIMKGTRFDVVMVLD